MLEIVFTNDDLMRTRVIENVDPLWETALSLHQLQSRTADAIFGDWRRTVRRKIPRLASMLATLVPPTGDFADFLTPAAARDGLEAGLETVKSTPAGQIRADLAALARRRPLPSWTRRLADTDGETIRLLADVLRDYHLAAVAPLTDDIQARLDAERAVLGRLLLDGGTEHLLGHLRPWGRWEAPVLAVDYPRDQTIHLGGRGLTLIPSYFCWTEPITLINPDLEPVLVYPVLRNPGRTPGPIGRTESRYLAELLGGTRSLILGLTADGPTTTELGRRAGVSAATASRHATALRNAGLTTCRRNRSAVTHHLTALGAALLNGTAPTR